MDLYNVLLIFSIVVQCWCSPMPTPRIQMEHYLADSELNEVIRSLNLATNVLNNDPAYLNLAKDVEKVLRNENQKMYPKENINKDVKGTEIEYDTTKLIVKTPEKHENVINMFYPSVQDDQQQLTEDIVGQQQSKQNYIDYQDETPQNGGKHLTSEEQQQSKEENVPYQQQIQQNREDQQQYYQQEPQQPYFDSMQEQEDFVAKKTAEQLENNKQLLQNEQQLQYCVLNCDVAEIHTPICAINANNKYLMFENECEMNLNNCLNPEIGWQPVPTSQCKNSIEGFFLNMHKNFHLENDSNENIIRNQ